MLGLPVRLRDHDRPECGGRGFSGFSGFSGSRRGHGRPRRKGDGRGYKGLVAAEAVGPSGRVAAGTVGTAEVPRARGCGAGGATKVVRLAEAGGC